MIDRCLFAAESFDSWPLDEKHAFKRLIVGPLRQSNTDVEKLLFKDEVQLAKTLTGFEWWVLERDITGPIQRDILRLGKEGKREEIHRYLCELFREGESSRLARKVVAWFDVPYLSARREIIEQCLQAHKDGRFYLSVVTLLPLLDGLTRSFRRQILQRARTKLASGKPRATTVEVLHVAAYYLRSEPTLWGRPFFQIVDKLVYGKFQFGSEAAPSSLNRHGILHGEISDYGTETNSLKVFLLLDTIQHFYKEVQRGKAKRARRAVTLPPAQRPSAGRITAATSRLK